MIDWKMMSRLLESTTEKTPTQQVKLIATELDKFDTHKSAVIQLLAREYPSNNIGLAKAKSWLAKMFDCFDDEIEVLYAIDGELGEAIYLLDAGAETQRNIEISDVRKNARNKLEVFENNINYLKEKLRRSFVFADETDYGKDILNFLIPHINVKTHFQDADKKNLENFSNNKIDCIINVLKLSQGIDIQNLNTIVLFATPTGRQFIQRIGRVLRKDKDNLNKKAIIVDFFDEDDLKNENEESSDYRRYLELKKITEARYEPR